MNHYVLRLKVWAETAKKTLDLVASVCLAEWGVSPRFLIALHRRHPGCRNGGFHEAKAHASESERVGCSDGVHDNVFLVLFVKNLLNEEAVQ